MKLDDSKIEPLDVMFLKCDEFTSACVRSEGADLLLSVSEEKGM